MAENIIQLAASWQWGWLLKWNVKFRNRLVFPIINILVNIHRQPVPFLSMHLFKIPANRLLWSVDSVAPRFPSWMAHSHPLCDYLKVSLFLLEASSFPFSSLLPRGSRGVLTHCRLHAQVKFAERFLIRVLHSVRVLTFSQVLVPILR